MSAGHRGGMPIVARLAGPEAHGAPRSAVDASNGGAARSGALLPSGRAAGPSRAAAPHRKLPLDALLVTRTLRDRPRLADPWREPAFAREVDLVRDQLAPIRSRRSLAASFERESFRWAGVDEAAGPVALPALRVAYALRWLELADGVMRPGWTSLVAGRG